MFSIRTFTGQASRPDEDFVIILRIADERCQDDPWSGTLYGRYFVDAAAVEKVKITRLHFDAMLLDFVFCDVFVEGAIRELASDLRSPDAPVHDGMRALASMSGILEADKAGELVGKTRDRKIKELVSYSDVVDVGTVSVTSVVDAKDGWSIETSVGLTGHLDLLACCQCRQSSVEGIYRIIESIE